MIYVQFYFNLESAHTKKKFTEEERRDGVEARWYLNAILQASNISVLLSNAVGVGKRAPWYNCGGKFGKTYQTKQTHTPLDPGIMLLLEICLADRLIMTFQAGNISCISKKCLKS